MLALYLAAIYSRQLSNSSQWSTTKIHPYISGILQSSFTQTFFHFFRQMPVYLATQRIWCGLSNQPCCCFPEIKRNAFNITDEIFENLNTVSNIFKESHNFLVFEGSVTTYISLRKNQLKVPRKITPTDVFLIRGTSIFKITEMGFGILIKYFWAPFFAAFYCQEGISCFAIKSTKRIS